MSNASWSVERWRIVLVLFTAILLGLITSYWLEAFAITLIAYTAWLLYKIQQLNRWLEKGANRESHPDSNGIWEHLVHQIQGMKKKSLTRKRRTAKLVKRMQGIITGLPYATVVLNQNNEIDWANKKANVLLNINNKNDRGNRVDNLIRLPELTSIIDKGEMKSIELALPHDNLRPLNIKLIPIQDDLKLLIARDISERVNVLQMRKSFIANASHELRTPLTVVSGYLEILQTDDRLPQDLKKAVDSASEQSLRMQNIINDLLMISRLENSLNNSTSEVLDMPKLLRSIIKEEQSLIKNNSHTLSTQIDESLLITGNELEMISVCSNLIHNAVRHTQNGTVINIIWEKNKASEACLSVSDNGQGISKEHISHLTERFYRVDKGRSRDKGGTGLGLSIVHHIVQRHGGHLKVTSSIGKGTDFVVCFPSP